MMIRLVNGRESFWAFGNSTFRPEMGFGFF
jgi:hypothetical protein